MTIKRTVEVQVLQSLCTNQVFFHSAEHPMELDQQIAYEWLEVGRMEVEVDTLPLDILETRFADAKSKIQEKLDRIAALEDEIALLKSQANKETKLPVIPLGEA